MTVLAFRHDNCNLVKRRTYLEEIAGNDLVQLLRSFELLNTFPVLVEFLYA